MRSSRKLSPSRVLFLLAVVGTLASPAHAQPSPTPAASSPIYTKGQEAFAVRQYRLAADLFATAAAHDQPPTDALLMQAKSLVKLGDFPAAEPVLRHSLTQAPRSSPTLYLLGYVLQRQNKPRESLAIFTEAAALTPPLPDDLKLVALDYILLDDYPDALHWLLRAVAGDPHNVEAWYDLGRAQMHQSSFAEAEHAFRQALQLDAHHVKTLDNLGLALEAQNRTDEALIAYEQAVKAQSGTPHPSEQPLLDYGTLLNTRNRSADAIPPLRSATNLAPACSRCHEELARAHAALHQDVLARSEMERAVALDPHNPRLHYQLGQIYRRAGLLSRSRQELAQSAALYGTQSSRPEDKP